MKSEVSNTLIKELHGIAGCLLRERLEAEVPELFKPKYVEGKWYVAYCNSKVRPIRYIMKYTKEGRSEISGKEWCEEVGSSGIGGFDYIEREATPKEVEDHLISIAEKKGFKQGCEFISAHTGTKALTGSVVRWRYDSERDTLWMYGSNGGVYQQGKWAEIIKEESPIELTLSDIAKLKGVDVSRIRIVE
jgi:hypothetical protein